MSSQYGKIPILPEMKREDYENFWGRYGPPPILPPMQPHHYYQHENNDLADNEDDTGSDMPPLVRYVPGSSLPPSTFNPYVPATAKPTQRNITLTLEQINDFTKDQIFFALSTMKNPPYVPKSVKVADAREILIDNINLVDGGKIMQQVDYRNQEKANKRNAKG